MLLWLTKVSDMLLSLEFLLVRYNLHRKSEIENFIGNEGQRRQFWQWIDMGSGGTFTAVGLNLGTIFPEMLVVKTLMVECSKARGLTERVQIGRTVPYSFELHVLED